MNNNLRKIIREIIEEELMDEESSSGAAGAYSTPFAFRGNSAGGKEKQKKNAENSGYRLASKKDEKADEIGDVETKHVTFGKGELKGPEK